MRARSADDRGGDDDGDGHRGACEGQSQTDVLVVEELTAQSRRIAELIASIDEKTMRWLELSER